MIVCILTYELLMKALSISIVDVNLRKKVLKCYK